MQPSDSLRCQSADDWERWLEHNHRESDGVWLHLGKKGGSRTTLTYEQALEQALCFGWIDGQVKRFDEDTFVQRFTPRRAKSVWSKINVERIEKLTREGRMRAAGLEQVEKAKKDGRWAAAYDPPSQVTVPDDFAAALEKNPAAKEFFETLNKTNRYAILWRLQTAKKPETRQRRMDKLIGMLQRGEKLH